jgi:hypothetical protein
MFGTYTSQVFHPFSLTLHYEALHIYRAFALLRVLKSGWLAGL